MRVLCLVLASFALLLGLPFAARPCSLCNPNLQQSATLRQDSEAARFIVYGTVTASRLLGDGASAGTGASDIRIVSVLKADPFLAGRKTLTVPQYVPVNEKDPPKYLLFCDVVRDRLEVFRGTPAMSEAAPKYIEGLLALKGKTHPELLRYCFPYLDHPDKELANDAFLEFAKARDHEVGEAASTLSPQKLREWLTDPKTPDLRLGLYAFLLGACGEAKDAEMLLALIRDKSDRTQNALDGLLGGYIQLNPRAGWELAFQLLEDQKQPFATRYAVIRLFRFYHGWRPRETHKTLLRAQQAILAQSDLADIAVEDMRRWKIWDLTGEVLRLVDQKGYEAPLMQRAIARYALSCPKPEAVRFAAELRRKDADLYNEVAELLEYEKR